MLPVPNIIENGDPDKSLLPPNTITPPEISCISLSSVPNLFTLIIEFGTDIFVNFVLPIIIVLLQSYVLPIFSPRLIASVSDTVKRIIEFVAELGSNGLVGEPEYPSKVGTLFLDWTSNKPYPYLSWLLLLDKSPIKSCLSANIIPPLISVNIFDLTLNSSPLGVVTAKFPSLMVTALLNPFGRAVSSRFQLFPLNVTGMPPL